MTTPPLAILWGGRPQPSSDHPRVFITGAGPRFDYIAVLRASIAGSVSERKARARQAAILDRPFAQPLAEPFPSDIAAAAAEPLQLHGVAKTSPCAAAWTPRLDRWDKLRQQRPEAQRRVQPSTLPPVSTLVRPAAAGAQPRRLGAPPAIPAPAADTAAATGARLSAATAARRRRLAPSPAVPATTGRALLSDPAAPEPSGGMARSLAVFSEAGGGRPAPCQGLPPHGPIAWRSRPQSPPRQHQAYSQPPYKQGPPPPPREAVPALFPSPPERRQHQQQWMPSPLRRKQLQLLHPPRLGREQQQQWQPPPQGQAEGGSRGGGSGGSRQRPATAPGCTFSRQRPISSDRARLPPLGKRRASRRCTGSATASSGRR